MNLSTLHPDLWQWVVIPALIFGARIADVSLQTLRILFVSKSLRLLAAAVGFFEVLIWIFVLGVVMKNLSNWLCYIAYAGGFATGSWVGIWLEQKLSLGLVAIRVITHKESASLIDALRAKNYGVTAVDAHGSTGKVDLIFTVIARRKLSEALDVIHVHNPQAFISVQDVKTVEQGVFPRKVPVRSELGRTFRWNRQGK